MGNEKDYRRARGTASRSDYMLERARDLLSQAMELPEEDQKRQWLQDEAARLIEKAEQLTNFVKKS